MPRKIQQQHPHLGMQKVENFVRSYLCKNWWNLQRAIEKSLDTTDDPRPMFFVIASNLNKFVTGTKTQADLAMVEAAQICD